MFVYYLQQAGPGAFQEPRSCHPPEQAESDAIGGEGGGSCRHFVFLTYFVHQNGQYAEAIAVSCEDEDHLVAIVPENVRDPNKRVNVKSGDDQKIIGCNVQ